MAWQAWWIVNDTSAADGLGYSQKVFCLHGKWGSREYRPNGQYRKFHRSCRGASGLSHWSCKFTLKKTPTGRGDFFRWDLKVLSEDGHLWGRYGLKRIHAVPSRNPLLVLILYSSNMACNVSQLSPSQELSLGQRRGLIQGHASFLQAYSQSIGDIKAWLIILPNLDIYERPSWFWSIP